MSSSHTQDEWLVRMEAQSRAKQEQFMNRIAQRLNRPRMTERPAQPFRGAPDFWRTFEWNEQERIERFTQNFLSVGGHVERLDSMEEASDFIAAKARELDAKTIVRQQESALEQLGLEAKLAPAQVSAWNSDGSGPDFWKARAAEADIGVVMADYAVAYTGSVAVLSSPHKGRSVSLLPTVLMILIPAERLKTRLGEILPEFDELGQGRLPAGIHFISGPSRSSDIENDLTIGVHGPGIVYALIIG